MRWILVLLTMSVLRLSAGEPTEAVMAVLNKLAESQNMITAPKELAISPFCGPEKRSLINESWKMRSSWIRDEKVIFVEGFERVDEDLAAVLVGARSSNSPDSIEMMAFGLQRVKDQWKVAPVEGSFQSMGLGFGRELKRRISELENWMAVERVSAGSRLRDAERERYRKEMLKVVDSEFLKSAEPQEVMSRFLKAAREGRTNELLVWQGILERDANEAVDWDSLVRITRRGMGGRDARGVWKLLTDPGVLQIVMEGDDADEEDASILVAFISSFETGLDGERLRPVRFKFQNDGEGWRVKLPIFFANADDDRFSHSRAHQRDFDWNDEELAEKAGTLFEQRNAPLNAPDPAVLMSEVGKLLRASDFKGFVRHLYRDSTKKELPEPEVGKVDDVEEAEKAAVLVNPKLIDLDAVKIGRYQEAAAWWSDAGGAVDAATQRIYEEDDLALGILRIEPSDGAWEPTFLRVWMTRNDDGWIILPGRTLPFENLLNEEQKKIKKKFVQSVLRDQKLFKEEYLASLIKEVGKIDPAGKAVAEAEAKALVEEWREAITQGKIQPILEKAAALVMPKKPSLFLQELSYQMKGAAAAVVPDQVIGVHGEGRFTGVTMMIDSSRGLAMECPLVLVVATEKGSRILADTELYLPTNKAKRMRNDLVLEKLEKEMAKEDFASVKKLMEWNEKVARPVWDQWNEEQAAQNGE